MHAISGTALRLPAFPGMPPAGFTGLFPHGLRGRTHCHPAATREFLSAPTMPKVHKGNQRKGDLYGDAVAQLSTRQQFVPGTPTTLAGWGHTSFHDSGTPAQLHK